MVAKKRVVEKNLWSKPTKVSINKILDQDVFEDGNKKLEAIINCINTVI